MSCAICFEKISKNIPKTECGHHFHINCIRKWAYTADWKVSCPLCRKLITIYPNTRSQKNNTKHISIVRNMLIWQNKSFYKLKILYAIDIFNYIWKYRIVFRIHPTIRNMIIVKIKELKEEIEEELKDSNILILNKILDNFDNF